ncbi:hypothetical protein QBC42DRAFT_266071 [Cladorrhinum samala]|uniref:Uncharacterized protein n=1 Tax=Cladorrhinum samala TaxID=585594 RepID=A0AAV9HU26_9PEZI|nr:hypothetical protein QBC42DRAFT_266071 [Cladorrhinum samala]
MFLVPIFQLGWFCTITDALHSSTEHKNRCPGRHLLLMDIIFALGKPENPDSKDPMTRWSGERYPDLPTFTQRSFNRLPALSIGNPMWPVKESRNGPSDATTFSPLCLLSKSIG